MKKAKQAMLKPCPFCQCVFVQLSTSLFGWIVQCCNIGCAGIITAQPTKAKAIRAWNRRVKA